MYNVNQRMWFKFRECCFIFFMYIADIRGISVIVGAMLLASFFCLSGMASALDSRTLPTKGQITAGKGSIAKSGRSMTVKQSTPKMIVNWKTFNIGAKAKVKFKQPDAESVALNKIYDQNPSQI